MRRTGVAAVTAGLLLAGCTSTVVGSPGPADRTGPATTTTTATTTTATSSTTTASRPPTTTAAPTTTVPAPTATPADVPALVTTVETVFDALAAADYRTACTAFDLGEEPPQEATLQSCATALESGFTAATTGTDPETARAGQEALATLTVLPDLVVLSGSTATVPNAAIVSTAIPDRSFYGADIGLVLTAAGWRVDAGAFT